MNDQQEEIPYNPTQNPPIQKTQDQTEVVNNNSDHPSIQHPQTQQTPIQLQPQVQNQHVPHSQHVPQQVPMQQMPQIPQTHQQHLTQQFFNPQLPHELQQYKTQEHQEESREEVRSQSHQNNQGFYFCCKKCKTTSKFKNKTCVCVVPRGQRRVKLTSVGCRICGCKGCTKEDKEYFNEKDSKRQSTNNSIQHRQRQRSFDSQNSKRSGSSYSSENVQLNNFQNSVLTKFIQTYWQVYPPMIGIGIPERTESYILGKTKKANYF